MAKSILTFTSQHNLTPWITTSFWNMQLFVDPVMSWLLVFLLPHYPLLVFFARFVLFAGLPNAGLLEAGSWTPLCIIFLGVLIPLTLKYHVSSYSYQLSVSSPALSSECQTCVSKYPLHVFSQMSHWYLLIIMSKRTLHFHLFKPALNLTALCQ